MTPIFSESVYNTLYHLVTKQKSLSTRQLGEELSKAKIVKDNALKKSVVSLNSTVQFTDDSISEPIQMQIVLPEEMDLSQRKISILAPISIALIGYKQGDNFTWQMPAGLKTLNILKVTNI